MKMVRGRVRKLTAGLACLFMVAGVTQAQAAPDAKGQSLYAQGKATYAAMMANAAISKGASAATVVLVRDDNLADALSAAALAGSRRGTILSVPSNGYVPSECRSNIQNAQTVYIMGGTGAIASSLEYNLRAVKGNLNIQRVAGANRFATAARAAQIIGVNGVASSANITMEDDENTPPMRTAIIVNGYAFADGVTAGAMAYGAGAGNAPGKVYPILLVNRDSVPAETIQALKALQIERAFFIGGRGVISEAAEGQLMREAGIEAGAYASGGNRYDSAMRFANSSTVPAAEAGLGWSLTNVGIADLSQAAGGHDALVAAPYFGITRTPVIGSDRGGLPAETIRYLQDSSDTLRNVMFVSSTGGFIFSQATVSQAVSAARGGGSGGGVG